MKKVIKYALILAAVLASAALASRTELFHWMENKAYDSRVSLTAPFISPSDRIGIVIIDQDSLNWARKERGWGWPWPRESGAELLSYFGRSGASCVAFDMIYSEPSLYGTKDDEAFAGGLKKFGKAVLAKHRSQVLNDKGEYEILETGPIPVLAEACALVADVTGLSDSDGIIRRELEKSEGDFTLSCAALEVAGEYPREIAKSKQGGINIRYLENLDRYVPYKASAILKTEEALRKAEKNNKVLSEDDFEGTELIPPQQFEDNYIFVGVYAPGLFDICSTPVGANYQGVGVHVSLLDTILHRNWIVETGAVVTVLAVILACVIGMIFGCSILSRRMPSMIARSLCVTGLAALYIAGSYYAFYMGTVIPVVLPVTFLLLSYIVFVFEDYITEGKDKRFLNQAFRQYLSPAVIDQLMQNHSSLKLGGEEREITAYFSDIEGFTSISESLPPEKITEALNRYLTAMTDVIIEHGGTLDKYYGDAIVAFWNAPVGQEDHAKRAVEAALAAQKKLAEMEGELKELTGKVVRQRIGINTGKVVVGNMGSTRRFNYTMLGDTVNLACRLEALNKQFATYTMCSEATMKAARSFGSECYFHEVGNVAVVGKKSGVRVFNLMPGEEASAGTEKSCQMKAFTEAYELFLKGEFRAARKAFEENTSDPVSQKYVEKCQKLIDNPPDYQWDGIIRATEK